jgi:hypothetical protein
VTLLELLTTPAPAGVIAPDLVLVVDDALLDDRHRHRFLVGIDFAEAALRAPGGGGRGSQRSCADGAFAA